MSTTTTIGFYRHLADSFNKFIFLLSLLNAFCNAINAQKIRF